MKDYFYSVHNKTKSRCMSTGTQYNGAKGKAMSMGRLGKDCSQGLFKGLGASTVGVDTKGD